LGVGGGDGDNYFFPNQNLVLKDVIHWKCSLFIIDYIRIYKWVDGNETIKDFKSNNVSVDEICESIMPSITPRKMITINTNTSPLVYVIISVLSIFFLSIIVFLLIRMRNMKRIFIDSKLDYDDTRLPEKHDDLNIDDEYEQVYDEVKEYRFENEDIEKNR
jgi:hypothetical protein